MLFYDSLPRWVSIHNSLVSLFIFYILSYLLSKTMGCHSGCLMSSASLQKLFCGIFLAFKCSFNEFLGEKVISPTYSSAILEPPLSLLFILFYFILFLSLLFNKLSRLVITFLPRSKHLLISWLQSQSAVILEPKKIMFVTVSIVSPSICREVVRPDALILVF